MVNLHNFMLVVVVDFCLFVCLPPIHWCLFDQMTKYSHGVVFFLILQGYLQVLRHNTERSYFFYGSAFITKTKKNVYMQLQV